MPRRAKRSRPSLVQPLTFSPFARSVAVIANASSSKRDFHELISPAGAAGVEDERESVDQTGGNENKIKQAPTYNETIKDDADEEISESESSDEDTFDGTVQVDFAFFDPKESDFHGVKLLLQNYLGDKQWDLSGFVDLILGQPTVGSVVKAEDAEDDGIFSVVTALNVNRYKDHKCIGQLKEYLTENCQDEGRMSDLTSLLAERTKDVGLLVSQHVANLPPQLLPPLYEGLFNEVLWATEDEPTEELRNCFKFKTYLMTTKIYKLKSSSGKRKHSADDEIDIVFTKPEDEVFYELCSWFFSFPLTTAHLTPPELKNYRPMGLVMAIKAEKVPTFQQKLKSLIDES
ncbi:hypothetical protein MLD38_011360 [Melastoma candidum]|uniref:Uncharacterized protein n=1 Tax=Melastoma candidum TaxID=119954 RepID=A0ACB9RB42_9MYRT|nr:hypothetical protein MLD38_011360 [Melastoma candidum]